MTFEEAKDILKKEGYELEKVGVPCSLSIAFTAYESPEICEAMQVVCSAGYAISIEMRCFNARKSRLKKELAEHSNAPVSGKEKAKKGNPALKEASSQFNDALLNEQAKEIERLKNENEDWKSWHEMQNRQIAISNIAFRNEKNRLGKEIARLNKVIHKKNLKIEELKKESSEHLDGKVKLFGETVDLSQELCDKNEELRLTKIREKNLAELGLKYVVENEKLKNELADKVVDKIDAQALKSAESALAWKEKKIAEKDEVIAELREKLKSINMNRHNERICKKQLAEKDEVIADLGKELAEAKKLNTAKILDFNAKCMRAARESINDVFESYAAKYAKSSLDDLKEKAYESFNAKAHKLGLVGSKDGNGIIDQMVGADFAEEGADLCGVIVLCGKDFIDALKNVKDVWQE